MGHSRTATPIRNPRSWAITGGAAIAVAALLTPAAASAAPAQHPEPGQPGGSSNAARAASSYEALTSYLAAGDGSGLFHEQYPVEAGDNAYSYEWPFSQAHIAIADLANQPGELGRRYDSALAAADAAQEHYWKADGGTTGLPGYASYALGQYGNGGDFFYDDNEWVGLLDVQRYLTDHSTSSLERAEQIFDLVVSGWDTDATHAAPGGVFWTQAAWSTDRNTVSNMPAAELGVRLFLITGENRYLDWALRMYHWTNANLQRPDGLYADHLSLTGAIDPTVWSYNQGVPVGVNVLLYEATNDRGYLTEAQRIASAASSYFGQQGRLEAQPDYFNSIYFKNLLMLESVTGGSTYRKAAQSYADTVWASNRDSKTGLFHFGSDHTQTLEQAAMIQLYAVLNWTRPEWRNLY